MFCAKSKSSSRSNPPRRGGGRSAWLTGLLLLCLAPAIAGLGALPERPAPSHKIQVSDPAVARQLEKQGARLIADYGSFQLLEAGESPAPAGLTAQAKGRDEYNSIRLNTGAIDTSKPAVQAARKTVATFTGKRLHLVHFAGPPRPEWVAELRGTGVRLVSYVPHNAYLVFGDAAALRNVQSMASRGAHVQWEGAYTSGHKVRPHAQSPDNQASLRGITTDAFAVQLVDDAETNPDTLALLDQLKLDVPIRFSRVPGYVNIVVRLPASAVTSIAEQADVVSIQPYFPRTRTCERQAQIVAGNLDGNLPAGPGYLGWLAAKGFGQAQFEASGFVVDVTDSGLDNGTTLPNHFGLYTGGDLGVGSRVAYARLEGKANSGSTIQGCDGHGTLNTHIIAGYDDRSGFPFTDLAGYHYGLGICPFVKVGSSVIFDPTYFTFPSYKNLLSSAYQSGARISSNSWGGTGDGSYDIDAQEYDGLARDAQPAGSAYPADGNQEMVLVFAAGNDGTSGGTTINPPGSAKNVIAVGASENVQSIGGTDSSGVSDTSANSANDIASFSSRGPCLDGRQKPDLVAPGTHVSGGVFQTSTPGSTGQASPCFSGTGVSGGPGGSTFFPLSQQFFTASSGTSHSTPAVAGGAALLRQYFINQSLTPPSPAMTKAYLVNSARYLNGSGANDTLWSPRQGMGGMDLGRAFDNTPRVLRDQLAADLFTASGQSRTFTANIKSSTEPLRLTLAWTDAPGSTSGSAFNNDLDLVVTIGGETYLGNVFSGDHSVPGGAADYKNNLESVFLPAGISGPITIQISAASINSDGVPNNEFALDQDFALVVCNAELVPLPAIREAGSELLIEGCSPTNGVIDPGETVTVNFGLKNLGTLAATNLTATLLSTGGVTSVSAPQNYGLLPVGETAVSRPFSFVPSGGPCGSIITAHLQVRDGSQDLGIARFTFVLGQLNSGATFTEHFDGVTAPSLPPAWTASKTISGVAPAVSTGMADTLPNAVFFAEPDLPGTADLTSPALPVVTRQAQLSFRHRYDTEIDPYAPTLGYDGGVLEIKVGTNGFTDILAAGGSFVTGGYTRELDPAADNPLGGRRGWCGNSTVFVETLVNLPAAAAESTVQFKWRFATDSGNYYGGSGWHLDSVTLVDGSYSCCTTVLPGPVNAEVLVTGSNVLVRISSTAGYSYVLDYKDDLHAAAWSEILPSTPGTGEKLILEDPAGEGVGRFYRVRGFRP